MQLRDNWVRKKNVLSFHFVPITSRIEMHRGKLFWDAMGAQTHKSSNRFGPAQIAGPPSPPSPMMRDSRSPSISVSSVSLPSSL